MQKYSQIAGFVVALWLLVIVVPVSTAQATQKLSMRIGDAGGYMETTIETVLTGSTVADAGDNSVVFELPTSMPDFEKYVRKVIITVGGTGYPYEGASARERLSLDVYYLYLTVRLPTTIADNDIAVSVSITAGYSAAVLIGTSLLPGARERDPHGNRIIRYVYTVYSKISGLTIPANRVTDRDIVNVSQAIRNWGGGDVRQARVFVNDRDITAELDINEVGDFVVSMLLPEIPAGETKRFDIKIIAPPVEPPSEPFPSPPASLLVGLIATNLVLCCLLTKEARPLLFPSKPKPIKVEKPPKEEEIILEEKPPKEKPPAPKPSPPEEKEELEWGFR